MSTTTVTYIAEGDSKSSVEDILLLKSGTGGKVADALKTARDDYARRYAKSAEIHTENGKVLPGGSTRSSIHVDPFPVYIERAQGIHLYDVEGNRFTDYMSDLTSALYGKTPQVLIDAISNAMKNGMQLGAHSPAEGEFARQLCNYVPSFDQVRFTTSGTDANLFAICLAQRYTDRQKILVFEKGFHGSILHNFNVRPGVKPTRSEPLTVPLDWVVCPYNDIDAARKAAQANKADIAAILVEPMQGAGGATPADPEFLRALREIATEVGALLIFDEVQTARLAHGGLQGKYNIKPDLTTVGKFFGGGFPFGAFGGRKDIMQIFDASKPGSLPHAGTWNNSVVTMVAGATAIKHLMTPERITKINDLGDDLRNSLNAMFQAEKVPFKVSGLGSINQLNCTVPGAEGTWLKQLFYFKLLERGMWIAQRGLICISFEHTEEDIREFIDHARVVSKEVRALL